MNFEALHGDKEGLFSIRVDGKYRLEFSIDETEGQPVLAVCTLEELSNHYKKKGIMATINRLPTHPGDVLKEELEVRGITQKEFSANTGISYTMLNEILNGKRPVTSDVAILIEAALGINPELLVNMQSRYNIAQSRIRPHLDDTLDRIHKMCASWLL